MKKYITDNKRINNNLYEYLEKNFEQFSNSEKKFIHFLLNYKKEAPFLSAREIANKTKIDPSNLVRFSKKIGFTGYPQLQNNLREILLDKISYTSDLDKAKSYEIQKESNAVTSSINKSYSNIKEMIENFDIDKVKLFSKYIKNSHKKIIIANRSSYSVGHFLYFELDAIIPEVYFVNSADYSYYNLFRGLNNKDIIIAIAASRYSKLTIDFAKYAFEKKVNVISITDNKVSPLLPISSTCLLVPTLSATFHNSNVAMMALADTIISQVFSENKENAIKRLEIGERIIKDNDLLVN